MTTVVASTDWIAADSFAGDCYVRKIHRVGDSLVGLSGDNFAECLLLLDWLRSDRQGERPVFSGEDSVEALELTADGRLVYWDKSMRGVPLMDALHGIGSGSQYAIGAIEAGATPVDAITIASRRDPNSKLPVLILWRPRK